MAELQPDIPDPPPEEQRDTFLRQYFGLAEDGFATLFLVNGPDRRTLWADLHDGLDATLAALNGFVNDHDLYYGLATRRERLDGGRRGGDVDCLHTLALVVDMDVEGPGHKGSVLFPDYAAALDVIERFPLAPTFIIDTGGGLQVGWMFDEPQEALGPFTAGLRRRAIAHLRSLAGEYSAAIDETSDAARVMRLPGGINQKEGLARPTVLLQANWDVRYGADDLDDILIELVPELPPVLPNEPKAGSYKSRLWPGTAFMAKVPVGDILIRAGFTYQRSDRAGNGYYVRPGKDAREGHSAVTYASDGHVTVFSTAVTSMWPTLEVRRPYDGFGLFAHLFHGGSFTSAQADLQAQGFGVADAAKAGMVLELNEEEEERERLVAELTPGRTYYQKQAPPEPEPEPEVGGDDPEPPSDDPPGGDGLPGRPLIIVNNRNLDDLVAETVVALQLYNESSPSIFLRGGVMVVLVAATTVPITKETMPYYCALAARFARLMKGEGGAKLTPATPPASLTDALVKMSGLPLPALDAISHVPIIRPDGTICTTPGYDHATRTVYAPSADLEGLNVPEAPTTEDVTAARDWLDEALWDFPFETAASRANAYAMVLTGALRQLIPAPTPLFGVSAKSPGTGKGMATDVMAYIATGHGATLINWAGETEARKRITASLMGGAQVLSIDNLSKPLSSDTLAALLTADTWSDRVLGISKQIDVPNRCMWLANGNGLRLAGDLPRRTILIGLDARVPQPWRRSGFRHPDLLGWVRANRRDLVRACLVLARHWFAVGCPPPAATPLGSFEDWTTVIGGIVTAAGIPGFLDDAARHDEDEDDERGEWELFLTAIARRFEERPFSARDVVLVVDSDQRGWHDLIPSDLINDVGYPRFAKALGERFGHRRDRRWNEVGLRIERVGRDSRHAALWQVLTGPPPQVPLGEEGDPSGSYPGSVIDHETGPHSSPVPADTPLDEGPLAPLLPIDLERRGDPPLITGGEGTYRGVSGENAYRRECEGGVPTPGPPTCTICGSVHADGSCPREHW